MEYFDKWVDWVWVPFVLSAVAFAKWVFGGFEQVRRERDAASTMLRADFAKDLMDLHDRVAKAEERQLQAADALERYIDVLHKKTNAVRDEIKDYKTDAERRFATKEAVEREVDRVGHMLAGLHGGLSA